MKLSAPRDTLLKPLQSVIGVVERRQTMPILANLLLKTQGDRLYVTATDLEVELVAETEVGVEAPGEITVPGRKLYDICKALPDGVDVKLSVAGDRVTLSASRGRFTLSSLGAADFPTVEDIAARHDLQVDQRGLRRLLEKTHFSMAHQDVRYYLNGLLLEADEQTLRAVGDGWTPARAVLKLQLDTPTQRSEQVILPRKAVLELQRLLEGDGEVALTLGTNHVRVQLGAIRFTSKLIDGRFPEYGRVVPSDVNKVITAECSQLRQALQRAAILSNEKFRGVRLHVQANSLTIRANNPEQEEAEEELEVQYEGEDMEIGFNVNYLLDALGAVDEDFVQIGLSDASSSCPYRWP